MDIEEKTKNYYDGIAKGYQNLYHQEQIDKINKILNYLPKKGNLLDIGAGTGILNQFLSKGIKLYSLDLSEEMLKLNPNINERKIIGSGINLPFENNYFDYLSSFTVFQDINNPKKAIRESYRVLKPNGIFILSFLNISKKSNIIIEEIFKYFKVEKKIKEEKDYIFILKKEI